MCIYDIQYQYKCCASIDSHTLMKMIQTSCITEKLQTQYSDEQNNMVKSCSPFGEKTVLENISGQVMKHLSNR